MEIVCKKLKFGNRWVVNEPKGRKGGIVVAWKQNVEVKQIWKSEFCMKIMVEYEDEEKNFGLFFCMLVQMQKKD